MQKSFFTYTAVIAALLLFCGMTLNARTKVGSLYYELNKTDHTASITYENRRADNYSSLTGTLNLPERIEVEGETYTVTEVSSYAFANCPIESVTFPRNIFYIQTEAFSNCGNLRSIDFSAPDSIATDFRAFKKCTSLTELSITPNVTAVRGHTFDSCVNLKKVILEKGSQPLRLGDYIFTNASEDLELYIHRSITGTINITHPFWDSRFKRIVIDKDLENFIDEGISLLDANIGTLCFEDSPKPLRLISRSLVEDWGNTSVIDSMYVGRTFTGPNLFSSARIENRYVYNGNFHDPFFSISKIAIGPYVEKAGPFNGMDALTSVYINPGPNLSFVSGCFSSSPNLKNVDIANLENWFYTSFETTGSCPISRAKSFTVNGNEIHNLVIPEGIEQINLAAFCGAENLTSLTVPSSLKKIITYAFYGCTNLKTFFIKDPSSWCSVINMGGPNVYNECDFIVDGKNLEVLNIPDSVKSIGYQTFKGCRTLREVNLPDNLTEIDHDSFHDCSALKGIKIPAALNRIGVDAFAGCTSLEFVDISDIEAWCNIDFSYFNSNPINFAKTFTLNGEPVSTIAIPKNVKEVMPYAFCGAHNLKSVFVGSSKIGEYAFSDCTNLRTLATNASAIGEDAFADSPIEKAYSMQANPPSIKKDYFNSTLLTMLSSWLYVPAGSKAWYTTSDWSVFPNIATSDFSELTDIFGFDVVAGIGSVTSDAEVRIVVDNGRIIIKTSDDRPVNATVYDSVGRTICTVNDNATPTLPSGVYIIAGDGLNPRKVLIR